MCKKQGANWQVICHLSYIFFNICIKKYICIKTIFRNNISYLQTAEANRVEGTG